MAVFMRVLIVIASGLIVGCGKTSYHYTTQDQGDELVVNIYQDGKAGPPVERIRIETWHEQPTYPFTRYQLEDVRLDSEKYVVDWHKEGGVTYVEYLGERVPPGEREIELTRKRAEGAQAQRDAEARAAPFKDYVYLDPGASVSSQGGIPPTLEGFDLEYITLYILEAETGVVAEEIKVSTAKSSTESKGPNYLVRWTEDEGITYVEYYGKQIRAQ